MEKCSEDKELDFVKGFRELMSYNGLTLPKGSKIHLKIDGTETDFENKVVKYKESIHFERVRPMNLYEIQQYLEHGNTKD
jgi:hypothetical protein